MEVSQYSEPAWKDIGLTVLINYQVQLSGMSDTQVTVVRKFLDEMLKFSSLWPGKMRLLVEQNPKKTEILETVNVKLSELPFQLQVVDYKQLHPAVLLEDTSIVYTAVGYKHNHISLYCKQFDIPCVYISEYSLQSIKQSITLEVNNPILRLRRNVWQDNQERKQVNAIKLASGIQCNGTPTYEEYRKINSNAFLYFDNRVSEDLLAKLEEVEERTRYLCENNEPLRLCFSGRLVKMKGADHLINVGQELKKLSVPFQMFICGDGDLKEMMQSRVAASGLHDSIIMMGMLNFKTNLLPFVKKNVDLFVCCHRQSDPSCTYLETMSCGVPIIGYANDAFSGVVRYSKTGWLINMNQPKLLAQKIAELNSQRQLIREMSFTALEFARKHTFEKTYERRIQHLKETYYQLKENQNGLLSLV
ncbi:MAG: glycosyltransferase family 4 protein [Scytonema sp. PMC 1069.18]|nr:glycosyltransferase family 4 protein [Scytonema sp. PMC 1069.18]MEC4880628.1 glycosyltransferase family 4 protein [Scytonema sp. PMC 1070.18]